MRSRILFVYFLLLAQLCQAQVFEDAFFREEARQGLDRVYNMEFDAAEGIFSKLSTAYSNHPGPHFLLALNRWWQSYISTSQKFHPYILAELEKALRLNVAFADNKKLELEYVFFQYMSYAFKTRVYILQREWIKAANHGRKALKYLEQGFEFKEQASEFYFSSGIYHYYAATYPENHPYIKPFMVFFPDGNEELGLTELKKASSEFNFAQIEALYYLSDIYLEGEKSYEKALASKALLSQKYPRNTWFSADYARSLIYSHRYQKAQEILDHLQTQFESQADHANRHISSSQSRYTSLLMMRVYHYQGLIHMKNMAAYDRAREYFIKSMKMAKLAQLEADPYLPSNMYHLGLCEEKRDQIPAAIAAYESALDLEENLQIKSNAEARLKRLR